MQKRKPGAPHKGWKSAVRKSHEPEELYNVDVRNTEGDVVKHYREVTADEVDDIRERYEDEPWLTVVQTEA